MMKPGKYYIGDLCYVLHDKWDEFCKITISDRQCKEGEFVFADGKEFATYGTMYGDGTYNDQKGNSYSVDAGLIGCVLVDDISDKENPETYMDLGKVHEFPYSFKTGVTPDGEIYFGHIRIKTGEQGYDDES